MIEPPSTTAVLVALFALVVWAWTSPVVEAQDGTVVVEGQVNNGTLGGGGVEGLTVVLHQLSDTVYDHVETITDAEGRFRYAGLRSDPELRYGVSVTYQGALYGMDFDMSAGAPLPITLSVYDSTDSDEALSVSSASVLFAQSDGPNQSVVALEIVKIANSSDRTYVPGPDLQKVVWFGLPLGAGDLQVDTALPGADYVQLDREFVLLASIPPGEHEVMFTYQFPYTGSAYVFTASFKYDAARVSVLAPLAALKLAGGQLGDPETVTIGERTYQLLQAENLPRGEEFSLRLEGLPLSSFSNRLGRRADRVRFEYAAPIGLGLLMVLLIGYALKFRSNERGRRPEESLEPPSADENRRTVSRLIADLERSFETGTLNEEEYRRIRAVLDARLASNRGD